MDIKKIWDKLNETETYYIFLLFYFKGSIRSIAEKISKKSSVKDEFNKTYNSLLKIYEDIHFKVLDLIDLNYDNSEIDNLFSNLYKHLEFDFKKDLSFEELPIRGNELQNLILENFEKMEHGVLNLIKNTPKDEVKKEVEKYLKNFKKNIVFNPFCYFSNFEKHLIIAFIISQYSRTNLLKNIYKNDSKFKNRKEKDKFLKNQGFRNISALILLMRLRLYDILSNNVAFRKFYKDTMDGKIYSRPKLLKVI